MCCNNRGRLLFVLLLLFSRSFFTLLLLGRSFFLLRLRSGLVNDTRLGSVSRILVKLGSALEAETILEAVLCTAAVRALLETSLEKDLELVVLDLVAQSCYSLATGVDILSVINIHVFILIIV